MPNPFDSSAMATGYANARPPVHPRVMEMVQSFVGRVTRALDVGCGAGLSTRALAPLADEILGLEPVEAMARSGPAIAPNATFLTGAAEALPFRNGCFELITAAGSLNYVRLPQFFPEARRVLRDKGILLVYDFSPGRSFRDGDALDVWFDRFMARYPPAVSEAVVLNPEILGELDSGFQLASHQRFEIPIPLTPEFYLEYILTGTNVAAAVRRGVPLTEIRQWCAETLSPVWQGRAHDVIFRGYYACLSR